MLGISFKIQIANKCLFFSCRIKRIEQKDELEQEKVGELSETEKLAEDNGKIREEIEALHRKYEALQKFALQKKIPLPSEMDPLH
jgi:transcription factor MAFF/G/K